MGGVGGQFFCSRSGSVILEHLSYSKPNTWPGHGSGFMQFPNKLHFSWWSFWGGHGHTTTQLHDLFLPGIRSPWAKCWCHSPSCRSRVWSSQLARPAWILTWSDENVSVQLRSECWNTSIGETHSCHHFPRPGPCQSSYAIIHPCADAFVRATRQANVVWMRQHGIQCYLQKTLNGSVGLPGLYWIVTSGLLGGAPTGLSRRQGFDKDITDFIASRASSQSYSNSTYSTPWIIGSSAQQKCAWYGDGSKPWYLVNPKIAGKWGCSSH